MFPREPSRWISIRSLPRRASQTNNYCPTNPVIAFTAWILIIPSTAIPFVFLRTRRMEKSSPRASIAPTCSDERQMARCSLGEKKKQGKKKENMFPLFLLASVITFIVFAVKNSRVPQDDPEDQKRTYQMWMWVMGSLSLLFAVLSIWNLRVASLEKDCERVWGLGMIKRAAQEEADRIEMEAGQEAEHLLEDTRTVVNRWLRLDEDCIQRDKLRRAQAAEDSLRSRLSAISSKSSKSSKSSRSPNFPPNFSLTTKKRSKSPSPRASRRSSSLFSQLPPPSTQRFFPRPHGSPKSLSTFTEESSMNFPSLPEVPIYPIVPKRSGKQRRSH